MNESNFLSRTSGRDKNLRKNPCEYVYWIITTLADKFSYFARTIPAMSLDLSETVKYVYEKMSV